MRKDIKFIPSHCTGSMIAGKKVRNFTIIENNIVLPTPTEPGSEVKTDFHGKCITGKIPPNHLIIAKDKNSK